MKPPATLPAHWRAPILDSLRAGVDYRKACGGLANYRASQALEQTDAAWAAEVAAALAEGARVRAERVAAATAQRAAEVAPQAAALQEVLRERIAAGDVGQDPVAFALTVGAGAQAIGVSGHVEASDGGGSGAASDLRGGNEHVLPRTHLGRPVRGASVPGVGERPADSEGVSDGGGDTGGLAVSGSDSDHAAARARAKPNGSTDSIHVAIPGLVGRAAPGAEPLAIAWHTTQPAAPGAPSPQAPSKRAAEHTDDGAPDWQQFRRDAERIYGPGRMGLYLLQDERLVRGGMPPTTPWWRKNFAEFFNSDLTWLLAMVGRGAGKSTNLERLLLLIVILTERVKPPGQPWSCPFMSVVERDAQRRIAELRSLLMLAYFIETKITGQSIKVNDCSGNEIEIVSTAGTIGQTSGPTTVGAFFDEAAKMHTAPGAANSDAELIASIVGTSRELQGWVGVRCSSAWETRGAHFANVMEGTNSQNYVATIGVDFIDDALAGYETVARWEQAQGNSHGAAQIRAFAKTLHPGSPNVATWVARPTLTALASRMKLETLPKDDPALEGLSRFDFWIREYGSMPLSREGGPNFADQCAFAAELSGRLSGRAPAAKVPGVSEAGLLINPTAPPGDARYGGPTGRGRQEPRSWRTRKVF